MGLKSRSLNTTIDVQRKTTLLKWVSVKNGKRQDTNTCHISGSSITRKNYVKWCYIITAAWQFSFKEIGNFFFSNQSFESTTRFGERDISKRWKGGKYIHKEFLDLCLSRQKSHVLCQGTISNWISMNTSFLKSIFLYSYPGFKFWSFFYISKSSFL